VLYLHFWTKTRLLTFVFLHISTHFHTFTLLARLRFHNEFCCKPHLSSSQLPNFRHGFRKLDLLAIVRVLLFRTPLMMQVRMWRILTLLIKLSVWLIASKTVRLTEERSEHILCLNFLRNICLNHYLLWYIFNLLRLRYAQKLFYVFT
jgi:hypothetical protein